MTAQRTQVRTEEIPSAFEGIIPSAICTVDADGVPNVTYLSVVHRIDEHHVALSRQFFKKTDENTLVNPFAQVFLIEPMTGRSFLLDLRYLRTETQGPQFERMRTRLDAVAAHEGMTNIFRLKGVDICEVLGCELLPGNYAEGAPARGLSIEKVEAFSRSVAEADDLDELLRITLDACSDLLGFRHAFIMLLDETRERLYTVASAGYPSPGTGSEVRVGTGIIGLAAARHKSIRMTQMARDLAYSHAALASAQRDAGAGIERVIPLPVLPSVQSQLITPMLAHRQLVGVLTLQSEAVGAFQAADECLAGIICSQVATAMAGLGSVERATVVPEAPPPARPVQVKYYRDDESVFLDNEYLIKGIAGGILWRLLRSYQDEQRVEFSNREIRLDQTLALPDLKDNLEARLILLRKRLEERCDYLRIEKTARGRFRLVVSRPLSLVTVEGGSPL